MPKPFTAPIDNWTLSDITTKPAVYDVTYTFTSPYSTPSEHRRRMKLCDEVEVDTAPLSTSGMWLAMAYAAGLLGMVQAAFSIARWLG